MTFLQFTEISDTGKTKVWKVENSNDGSYLGYVKWYGGWRRYVLSLSVDNVPAIWSQDCLQDVSNFIKKQMDKRDVNKSSN
jgi:hypothetical protein